MGFITFLFWFFLILYILRFLGRYVFPFLLTRYIKKKQEQFNHQFTKQPPKEEEGNVSINKKPRKQKDKTDDMGEYVDFEEMDE